MDNVFGVRLKPRKFKAKFFNRTENIKKIASNLAQGDIDVDYIIKGINTEDLEMKDFLFTLGCYEGERVTIISRLSDNYVISVKDARYSIDTELAEAIGI